MKIGQKCLHSIKNRQPQKSNVMSSLLLLAHLLISARNNVTNGEALTVYFSKVLSTGDEDQPTVIAGHGSVSIDPAVTEKETQLRLLQLAKPLNSNGPDDAHPGIVKSLTDVIAEPPTTRLGVSLRPSRDRKYTHTSQVYMLWNRHSASYYRSINLTSVVVKILERIIRCPF